MIKKTIVAACLVALSFSLSTARADAQGAQSRAVTGDYGRTSQTTNNYRRSDAVNTRNQRIAGLRTAGLGGVAQIHGPTGRNGLPQTRLDSFVLNAGGSAEMIYGDEGTDGPPPYHEFTAGHRIERGITGARASGLTTGHGSYMPCAWGGDEFVDGPEFSRSGSSNNGQYWAVDPGPEGNGGAREDMNPDDRQRTDETNTSANNTNNDSGF